MSMLDSFFAKGFKAAKCKTLLKLTIPRIKLLRNRREIQLKQMRRDIAKLLETGQEATARIRVEHIIREEKMMAAQEIVELFSELIAVRLPIIETQRECPLDLKEAISSVCFAAPRCADLPELQQVQMLFAAKYGKEFIAAATELMPECGVNRQLVELLSVRAPDPEVKLKLLKDIAAEHELDWDPAASEIELIKPHEDLLNGPAQFVSGSQVPLPDEKHDESSYAASKQSLTEESDSDDGFEKIDFPEVPKASVRQNVGTVSSPEMLPFPEVEFESTNGDDTNEENFAQEPEFVVPQKGSEETSPVSNESEHEILHRNEFKNISSENQSGPTSKQFVPFVSPPPSSTSFEVRESELLRSQAQLKTKNKVDVDLQDVLAAAQAAAKSAEQAAAAARSAASLAQVRISKIFTEKIDESENPFHLDTCEAKTTDDKPKIFRGDSSGENSVGVTDFSPQLSPLPSFDDQKVEFNSSFSPYYDNVEFDSSRLINDFPGLNLDPHQPQRLPSIDDEFFSYPNLFKRQDSNIEPGTYPSYDSSHIAK